MPGLQLDHRQTQSLSPRLQHAVRLLQMSSLEFGTLVRDALGKNPFLESEEAEGDDAEGPPDNDQKLEQDHDHDHDDDRDHDSQGDSSKDSDVWMADGGVGSRSGESSEFSALDLMPVETPLNSHLHGQLNVQHLPWRDLALARALVESLDDDGYLRSPLEELLDIAALDSKATLHEMQIALKRVQSLDPQGVGARNVAECLLLQLPSVDCPVTRTLAQTILSQHLQALAARDVTGLARRLGVSVSQAEAVCDRIRRLDPRPGWRFGSARLDYVTPDVLVKKVRGRWTVQLNPAIVPKVRLNQACAQLFKRHRTAADGAMGAHLQEARWTLRNVEQRFSTILDVATAIVKRQGSFLDYGAMAMKPLGLREVADEVGIHESTVSRVTNNKYMATPVGVFELKYFFSRAMVSASGRACSGTAIRELIKDIIRDEAAEQPLSDVDITRQLAQQGLVVARRTVTKYRQLLKIDAVDRRRRHA